MGGNPNKLNHLNMALGQQRHEGDLQVGCILGHVLSQVHGFKEYLHTQEPHCSSPPPSPWLVERLGKSICSVFPLKEGYILLHSKLVYEEQELRFGQWLDENVCNLLIYRDVLETHCSFLYHISNVVVPDLDVLGPVMKH